MEFKIHHTAMSVSNMERSLHFYGLFGFTEVHRWTAPDKTLEICHLKLDTQLIELFCFAQHSPLPKERQELFDDLKQLGCKHFALQVEDVQAAQKYCQEQGLETPAITQGKTGVQYFFIKDPDGALLEILQV